MAKIKEFIFNNLVIIILSGIIVFLIGLSIYLYYLNTSFECPLCKECETKEVLEKYYVDVKGSVKNPGVYEINSNNIVNDVIKLAGGFSKNAYTKNINLSKKVSDELVIYVYSKSEYSNLVKKENENKQVECSSNDYNIDNCLGNASIITSGTETNNTDTQTKDNKIININTATLEELMTLSGVGESKALSIIEYRNNVGGFKSIEEIKNVSGIGDAAFEKIKNNITI